MPQPPDFLLLLLQVHSVFFTISLFVGISLYSMVLAVIQHSIETKQLQAAEHLGDAGDELAAGIIVHDHHDEVQHFKVDY